MTRAADSFVEGRLFEREFARECVVMERLRATIVAAFMGVVVLTLSLIFYVRAADFELMMARPGDRWFVLLVPSLYLPFILASRRHLERRILTGQPAQRWRRFVAAALEVSVPTLAASLFVLLTTPVSGLHSPPTLLYPVMIVTWTLALDWHVCLFAGLLAAAQFLGLFAYHHGAMVRELPDTILSAPTPFMVRALMIVATGVLAALVAGQLRARVIATLRAVHEQARVRHVFGQHVSPAVVEQILDRGSADRPESTWVCVMFLDIRGFTRFSEAHTPAEVVDYLDRLFDPMLDCVSRHGGIVNKLLGDGFMAVFGAPVVDDAPEHSAVSCARALVGIVDALVAEGVIPETTIGVGLHAGQAITGNVGSQRRKEYTVIGDTVNLAARIEGLNRRFDSQILASATVVERAGAGAGAGVEALGAVEIRGRAEPVVLHQLA